MAVQMLYQSDLGGASCEQVLHEFRPGEFAEDLGAARPKRDSNGARRGRRPGAEPPPADRPAARTLEYARRLVRGTLEHRQEIDELLRQQAEHWRLERMPAVDRNILRLAVYEFLYETDVPKLVILDEAIELAKAFGSEQSGRFVNGMLDGILKSHTFPGSLT